VRLSLNLPGPLVRRLAIYAAKRNQSMTMLIADAIRRMIDEESELEAAKHRILKRLGNAGGRLPGGKISWSREELYER
jgi:hypothetical protein